MGPVLDNDLLAMPQIKEAIEHGTSTSVALTINNVDRSALGRLGGAVAAKYGDKRFPATLDINLEVGPWTLDCPPPSSPPPLSLSFVRGVEKVCLLMSVGGSEDSECSGGKACEVGCSCICWVLQSLSIATIRGVKWLLPPSLGVPSVSVGFWIGSAGHFVEAVS